jgi:asparagine synthetase B (glutamine-hydrolysing)
VFAQARREGCGTILDGYFGDQMLFGRAYLVDLARRGRWRLVRRHLREFGAWMTDAGPDSYKEEFWSGLLRSLVPRAVFQAVKKRAIATRTARYASWYRKSFVDRVLHRQSTRFPSLPFASRHAEEYHRHLTAGHYHFYFQRQSAAAIMQGLELACPFRDRDLAAFLMAIPGEIVNWRGVPKGLLREALTRTLPPSIRDRRWKADFTAFANQAVVRDYESIARLLTRDALAVQAGFVDGNRVEQSISAFKTTVVEDDTAVAGWQVGDLVALELWLRHFFGGGAGAPSPSVAAAGHEQSLF